MPQLGYTLFSEMNGPKELVRQAVAAERAGFDFAVISDHFHPWLHSHPHSPFAWSVLGAIADRTDRIRLGTLVTCPTIRYHPAIVAQAAATVACMSEGRFTLAVGSGENLNEHVVARGWPPVDVRHEMLREAVEIIRELWGGDYVTYRGQHLSVEDARIFTMPDEPPDLVVAGGGRRAARLAGELGDGLVSNEPKAELVEAFEQAGGAGRRRIGQVPCAYDRDERTARGYAMRFKFGLPGWKVMTELPNPVNFEAATQGATEDQVLEMVPAGPDPERYARAIREFLDAGFDEVCVVQVGEDHDGCMRFLQEEVKPLVARTRA